MAKIHEETVVIRMSKLIRETDTSMIIANIDALQTIEQIIQEMVGETVVVEVVGDQ